MLDPDDLSLSLKQVVQESLRWEMEEFRARLQQDVREELRQQYLELKGQLSEVSQVGKGLNCQLSDVSQAGKLNGVKRTVRNSCVFQSPHAPNDEGPLVDAPQECDLEAEIPFFSGRVAPQPEPSNSSTKADREVDNFMDVLSSPPLTPHSQISPKQPNKTKSRLTECKSKTRLTECTENLTKAAQELSGQQSANSIHGSRKCSRSDLVHRCRLFIKGEMFNYIMGVFLLANALEVGLQVNHMANQSSDDVPLTYSVLNFVFSVIFALELIARVWASHPQFWSTRAPDWKWNWLDTIVVTFSAVDELANALSHGSEIQKTSSSLGILRLLRLARVVRLVRMVRLIPALKSMVYLMMASMASFCWTCVLMSGIMFCVAVYFTEVTTDLKNTYEQEDMSKVQQFWGSIPLSILSLFMAITGGDDWRNMVDVFDIAHGSHLMNTMVFSIYIAFALLVVLNLVTGVFVEGAQRIIKEDKNQELVKVATRVFVAADIDSTKSLSEKEFVQLVQSNVLDPFLEEIAVSEADAEKLFYALDDDNSGEISLLEFVTGCLHLNQYPKCVDIALLSYWDKLHFRETCNEFSKMSLTMDTMQNELKGIRDQVRAVWDTLQNQELVRSPPPEIPVKASRETVQSVQSQEQLSSPSREIGHLE